MKWQEIIAETTVSVDTPIVTEDSQRQKHSWVAVVFTDPEHVEHGKDST